ncbi:MAG TPA: hypothetical protein VH352_12560 [Pseudonocardiaceae bacterium]|nr:hypothetical protein [Pseudonocardiaceae bacterium]
MRARTTAILLTAILVLTIVPIGWVGVLLLGSGSGSGFGLGAGLLALSLVGCWVAVANLRFGVQVQRLSRRLADEGELPDLSGLPHRPSGRVDRAAADAWFDERKAELDERPTDWRRWYRVALAYDLAGDRRRARETMRQALRLADVSVSGSGGGSPAASA